MVERKYINNTAMDKHPLKEDSSSRELSPLGVRSDVVGERQDRAMMAARKGRHFRRSFNALCRGTLPKKKISQ
jgi:hypothetical protein